MTSPALVPWDPDNPVQVLFDIYSANSTPEYTTQTFQVDVSTDILADLTDKVVFDSQSAVVYDSTATVNASIDVTLSGDVELTWGLDILAVYVCIRSEGVNTKYNQPTGSYARFPVGHFVVTSPGFEDLDETAARPVTGYDKNYLLQNAPSDSLAFNYGTTYAAAISSIFVKTGLATTSMDEVCTYPPDWAVKTLDKPYNWSLGDGSTYLSVINELLKASGADPLRVRLDGRWQIDNTVDPASAPIRWAWYGSETDDVSADMLNTNRAAIMHKTRYNGDVWNVPNRWIFIQSGLTFQPVEGSGQYTYNNTTLPPSDQITTGRILTSVQVLNASGQADLVTQGNAAALEALRAAETLTITTPCWPVGGRYDVFTYDHKSLPVVTKRRVRCTRWTLPLFGAPAEWDVQSVGLV